MSRTTARVRLELDERRARALHAALSEVLGAQLLAGDRRNAARELLDELDAKVPDWLSAAPIGGEAGYLIAADAVLRALADVEERDRSALSEIELLVALGESATVAMTSAGRPAISSSSWSIPVSRGSTRMARSSRFSPRVSAMLSSWSWCSGPQKSAGGA
jgi:hypothetical protein